jgi:hypothetical protein
MHLITAVILVVDGQLFQLAGDVVRGSSVHVPIGVDAVRAGSSSSSLLVAALIGRIIGIPGGRRGLADLGLPTS